jgi:hypothetical protein
MNIYELADEIMDESMVSGFPEWYLNSLKDASYMLRQQAARIAELEKCLIVEQEHNMMLEEKCEPVAWMFEYGTYRGDAVNEVRWHSILSFNKPDTTGLIRNLKPIYTTPQKYCPSEHNEAYEKGFIEGMAKQRDSSVDKWVNNTTPQTKPLSDDEYEEIMKQWDYWRKQIADGDTSSAPRDWFECILEAKVRGEK